MVIEMTVLLRIQHLKKCRRSISLVITACLVNFVQKHKRIGNLCLLKGNGNPSRHSTHISLSMSADLSFILHTTKTDTDITLASGFCNRFGNRSLTGSRRSHKAKYRRFSFMCQLTYRQEFHNTLFYILQTIMTFFKNLPGCLQVFRIFRALIPRKGKKCLNISPQNAALSGIGAGDFKAADFFENAILYFLGSSKLFGFSSELLSLISSIVLAKLLPYQFQLFSQNIFTLVFIYTLFQFLLKVMADIQHIDLIAQNGTKKLISVCQSGCLQKLLFALPGKRQINYDLVDQLRCFLYIHDLGSQFFSNLSTLSAISLEQLPDTSVHCLQHRLRQFLFFLINKNSLCS